MKAFLREHSYNAVKMFLNQFATGIFGAVLAIASLTAENPVLRNVTSIFAILFYLFLLYDMTWKIGFEDKIPIEKGRKKYRPFTGLKISLLANSLNFILAILVAPGLLLPDVEVLVNMHDVCAPITLFVEGMYTGVLANPVAGKALNMHALIYFLLPIPAMIVSTIAYILGTKDKKFSALFKPRTPKNGGSNS